MDLVRIATAGSVDDGKSTLIGRLLFDSRAILQDVLETTMEVSKRQSSDYLNLALITDGLRAEREQGITIDVAYRYFQTAHRKFILADTPGHVQYTRNMVTGASTADAALIIVDARNGVVEQTRRHTMISVLLGIKRLVVCVNKMDLVDYSQQVYEDIERELTEFISKLSPTPARFVPISALHGDNVVERSENMPWYTETPLLQFLEEMHVADEDDSAGFRLPVQYVIRPHRSEYHDYRAYAGTLMGGSLETGQEVLVQPAGRQSRITSIEIAGKPAESARAGDAVAVRLDDDIDISRGDFISSPDEPAEQQRAFAATVCWMSADTSLQSGRTFRIKQASKTSKAMVVDVDFRLSISKLAADESASSLALNDIGQIRLICQNPLVFDQYTDNRTTGSFILIDEFTNETVAAGLIGETPFVKQPA